MHKIKVIISKVIRRVCYIHWEIDNAIYRSLGEDNYIKMLALNNEKIFQRGA